MHFALPVPTRLNAIGAPDWEALLRKEGIEAGSDNETLLAALIHAEIDVQPWTLVPFGDERLRCPECAAELGGGPISCGECEFAFGNLWWHDQLAGRQGVMTMNEHALRVGRWILRYRHRHSNAIVIGWSLSMPAIAHWLATDHRRSPTRQSTDQQRSHRRSADGDGSS